MDAISLFYINNIGFAIELKYIYKSMSISNIKKLPNLPPQLLSFTVFNEQIVPIYNLAHFFNINRFNTNYLLFFSKNNIILSFAVEKIDTTTNYQIIKSENITNISFLNKNKILLCNNMNHFLLDYFMLFQASEMKINE
ncbi:chemotaxis protein CheW [Deferribacter abyssi]|uniref:chemotaxis protein CheW n=1 Tax=Deferribacter abyssi TaxID=213806 RepID=UPI003C14D2D9